MPIRRFALAVAAVALLAAPALADPVTVGDLTISQAWTRATPPGAPTAGGYLTITNRGSEADTLTAVSTPAAEASAIHVMEMKDGVMSMHEANGGVAIPPGGSVTLAPDGLHLMFMSLKTALTAGGELPVTLTFARTGKIDLMFPILPIGSRGPEAMGNMKPAETH